MKQSSKGSPNFYQVAKLVRARIKAGGEQLWRVEDFSDLPFAAVARALSRLKKEGVIGRLTKGTYYLARTGTFGDFQPNPRAARKLASRHKSLFPAGMAAANLLGFTTQTAKRGELSTSSSSLPRKLIGADTVIYTRRPEAWADLSETEAAILDFLRRGGSMSELSPEETVRRTVKLLSTPKTYARLAKVAVSEPPRVRALLGALGEQMKADRKAVAQLRASLNPLSRFEFGIFSSMPNAKAWQAKGRFK